MGNVSCGCARWEMLRVNYEEIAQFRLKYIRADGRLVMAVAPDQNSPAKRKTG